MIDIAVTPSLGLFAALIGGVLIGLVGGALPGISGITTMILLLPFVLSLDPAIALTLLLSSHAVIYTGGAIPAIALAIPGTPPNAAALEDGNRLAKLGMAARAIAVAATASGLGGLLGFAVLLMAIPLAIPILRGVGAPEIFMAGLAALICAAHMGAKSLAKGLIPGALGIFLGLVGYQDASGVPRLWFGQTQLLDGIGLIPLIMGLFAGPELVRLAQLRQGEAILPGGGYLGQIREGIKNVLKRPWLVIRSAALGCGVGLIPGVGGEAAAFLGHSTFGRPRRHVSEIDDCITGVIAAETSNNAKEGGALVPTLALGVPGSAGMAVLLGALTLFGLQPGPALAAEAPDLVLLLALILALANLLGSVFVLFLAPVFLLLIRTPVRFLLPVALTLATIGIVAYRSSLFDLVIAAAALVLGMAMARHGYNRTVLLLGFILAPLVETQGAIALAAYGPAFLLRPGVIIVLAVLVAAFLPWRRLASRWGQAS